LFVGHPPPTTLFVTWKQNEGWKGLKRPTFSFFFVVVDDVVPLFFTSNTTNHMATCNNNTLGVGSLAKFHTQKDDGALVDFKPSWFLLKVFIQYTIYPNLLVIKKNDLCFHHLRMNFVCLILVQQRI
jgi:hypothetical protein